MTGHGGSGKGIGVVVLAIASGALLVGVVSGNGGTVATGIGGPSVSVPTVERGDQTPTSTAAGTTLTTAGSGATTTTKKSSTATTKKGSTATTVKGSTSTTISPSKRPTVKLGSTGDDVTYLQQRLTALGFSPGAADGNFGAGTDKAVKAFQTAKGITADGVVATSTWVALG